MNQRERDTLERKALHALARAHVAVIELEYADAVFFGALALMRISQLASDRHVDQVIAALQDAQRKRKP